MGLSRGPGSPIRFRCSRCRRNWQETATLPYKLTGRWKQHKERVGVRSAMVSCEYECACGHHGWSNHVNLAEQGEHAGLFKLDEFGRVVEPVS